MRDVHAVPLRAVLIAPVGGSYLVLRSSTSRSQQAAAPATQAILPPRGYVDAGPPVPAAGVDPAAAVLAQLAPAPRRGGRRLGLWLAALLACAGGGGWWWNTSQARTAPVVTLAAVELRDLRTTVTATGSLEAVTAIEVGAEVTGRVREISVEENEHVHKGQVLAVLVADELAASVAQGRAQVAAAAASVELNLATVSESRFNLETLDSLVRAGVSSQQELVASRATLARSRASLAGAHAEAALARAGLAVAQSKLGKSTIVSPIDGIVLSRLVEPGQTVTAGFQTPVLFRVAQDLKTLRLRVDLDEADVAQAQADQSAYFEVAAFPGRLFPSRVVRVSHDSRVVGNVVAFGVTLEVDNADELLRPGMTCTATIITAERKGAVAVPNAALRPLPEAAPAPGGEPSPGEAGASYELLVLREGGTVAVPVMVGIADGEHTEIIAGDLRPTDQLMLEGGGP